MDHMSSYPTLTPADWPASSQLPYYLETQDHFGSHKDTAFAGSVDPGVTYPSDADSDVDENDRVDDLDEDDGVSVHGYGVPQGVSSAVMLEAEALTNRVDLHNRDDIIHESQSSDQESLEPQAEHHLEAAESPASIRDGSASGKSVRSAAGASGRGRKGRLRSSGTARGRGTGDDSMPDGQTINSLPREDSRQVSIQPVVSRGRGRGRESRGRSRGRMRGFGLGRGSQGGVVKVRNGPTGRLRGPLAREGPGRRPSLNRPVNVGQSFREFQSQATASFLEKDYAAALEHAKSAVLANPEVFAGHNLLSEIYREMGRVAESLSVLWVGAHVSREAGVWWDVLNRTKELSVGNKSQHFENMCYCYTKILSFDRKDYDAHRQRLDLLLELPYRTKALRACTKILSQWPTDLEIAQLYASVVVEGHIKQEYKRVKTVYRTAIALIQNEYSDESRYHFSFSDLDVYMDVFVSSGKWRDGLEVLKRVARWLCGRKNQTYWDAVTDNDCEWDGEDEPRRSQITAFDSAEFPLETYGEGLPVELRVKMGLFRLHTGSEHFFEAMVSLPRAVMSTLQLTDQQHFEYLEPTDKSSDAPVHEYPELFALVGNHLFRLERYGSALRFYEPLQRSRHLVDLIVLERMGIAYKEIDNTRASIRCYEALDKREPNQIRVLAELARLYNSREETVQAAVYTDRAMKQIEEDRRGGAEKAGAYRSYLQGGTTEAGRLQRDHSDSSRHDVRESSITGDVRRLSGSNDLENQPLFPKLNIYPPHNKTMFEPVIIPVLQKQRKVFSAPLLSTRMQLLRPKMLVGDERALNEWLEHAQTMMSEYQGKHKFFWIGKPDARYSDNTHRLQRLNLSSLNKKVSDVDHELSFDTSGMDRRVHLGISLSEWMNIFCEYALITAKASQKSHSYEALRIASSSHLLTTTDSYVYQIHLTWVVCALLLGDEETLCKSARWFVTAIPFGADAYRLFASVNLLFKDHEPRAYSDSATQKFFLGQIKAMDAETVGAENQTASDDSYDLASPNTQLLILYGHMLALADAPVSALNYYFRAYAVESETKSPSNKALICLSISVAYLQIALKNGCENRNAMVLRAMAFFDEYRQVRMSPEEGQKMHRERTQEVEFNEGRMYHSLGMLSEARLAYERCLAASKSPSIAIVNDEVDTHVSEEAILGNAQVYSDTSGDYTREAAFALQLICITIGDTQMAQKVADEWLVF